MGFREVVEGMVDAGLRRQTPSLQGRVRKGAINQLTRTCTVEIPSPHGGIDPSKGGQNFIELKNVPLPSGPAGFIEALIGLVVHQDRACTVGFKGGNLSFPYIVSFLQFLPDEDRKATEVPNRESVIANQLKTATAPRFSQWATNPLQAAAQFAAGRTAALVTAKVATNAKVQKAAEKIKTDLINPVREMFGAR